ncbi:MFS transporter [Nocardioides dongxiaopingii]|uniref:MFS transporter n=1 Tax=Nocardioides dongxiaopingii TaxID=2576036 RepID=UPI001FE943AD|nr:MFS transporter [Nocardioides dongxiaopingii]
MSGPSSGSLRGRVLVLVGIVVLALNLRPAAVSVGPVLDDVRGGLGMSGTEAGILTALPVVAFALFGALAPRMAERLGTHQLTAMALGCVGVGLLARSLVDDVVVFLLLSLLALAGMATANVVLPSLVKQHFPERVGTLTAVYSTALAVGITGSSILTVPISESAGGPDGWRTGLAAWSVLAGIALLPWLALLGRDRHRPPVVAGERIPLLAVGRTRLGRLMAALFALQSLQAYAVFGWFADVYREAGFSSGSAGLLLGVITGTSIPLSFLIPSLAGRMTNVAPLVLALGACYPVGYLGLILAPSDGAVVWALFVGTGTSTFPLVLTLIGLRARTEAGTASLSAYTQSVGYLFSAVGPFGVGVLHDVSGSWTLPLVVLTVLVVPLVLCGLAVSGPAHLEDELAARAP